METLTELGALCVLISRYEEGLLNLDDQLYLFKFLVAQQMLTTLPEHYRNRADQLVRLGLI